MAVFVIAVSTVSPREMTINTILARKAGNFTGERSERLHKQGGTSGYCLVKT